MFLKQNPHMITRELYERNIDELLARNKQVSMKGVTIERKDLRRQE